MFGLCVAVSGGQRLSAAGSAVSLLCGPWSECRTQGAVGLVVRVGQKVPPGRRSAGGTQAGQKGSAGKGKPHTLPVLPQ